MTPLTAVMIRGVPGQEAPKVVQRKSSHVNALSTLADGSWGRLALQGIPTFPLSQMIGRMFHSCNRRSPGLSPRLPWPGKIEGYRGVSASPPSCLTAGRLSQRSVCSSRGASHILGIFQDQPANPAASSPVLAHLDGYFSPPDERPLPIGSTTYPGTTVQLIHPPTTTCSTGVGPPSVSETSAWPTGLMRCCAQSRRKMMLTTG